MTMKVTYPHIAASKDPRPMTAQQKWSVADKVRGQLTPRPNLPRLDLERVVRFAGQRPRSGHAVQRVGWLIVVD